MTALMIDGWDWLWFIPLVIFVAYAFWFLIILFCVFLCKITNNTKCPSCRSKKIKEGHPDIREGIVHKHYICKVCNHAFTDAHEWYGSPF